MKADPQSGQPILGGLLPTENALRDMNVGELEELAEMLETSIENRWLDQHDVAVYDVPSASHLARIDREIKTLEAVNDLLYGG